MPVIADATNDEPPAKCCKYCEESTHSVDGGPDSWRLTLDQDLIDTLKGNFPSWFQATSAATAAAAANAGNSKQQQQQQLLGITTNGNCSITPISIDTKTLPQLNNTLQQQQQQQQQLQQVAILSNSCSSASPASSISSNCSKKSNCSSSSLSSCSSSSSSSSSSSCSSTSSISCKSLSQTTATRFLNKSSSTLPSKSLARTLKATQKTHHSNSSSGGNQKLGQLVKSASLHSLSSGGSSGSSGSGNSSLLATISTSPLTTVELISSAACNGLLATTLSGKGLERTFQDIILLHEAYDDMSEGEQRLHATFLGSSDDGNNSDCYDARQSPPKAIVDSSPLQPAMDKNKESLKVKLMVRRPHSQLVEQGIIPSLKTSPAIHEQCKQLERAKTSDLLKAKIQQRPNREDLERLHILEEDECHIDPSLAEKQRMLKKARLADQLNSQIQHRPGPLELIKKNILHTEKPIEKIVKEGLVSFKATSEGLLTRPQHPHSYVTFDEDSLSSESDTRQTPPRLDEPMPLCSTPAAPVTAAATASAPTDVLQAAAASAGIVTVALNVPTSGSQLVVTPPQLVQPAAVTTANFPTPVPPPPPPPPPMPTQALLSGIKVKQETANLFEELCQSVTEPAPSPGSQFLPMLASPSSLASSSSTLSPLYSIASPPHSLASRLHSQALQLQPVSVKSDAPGKDKNRKKSKSKPVSKARTIKFHEYKGPPSAAGQKQDATQPEETSYQLMLEQQNCLLKFLENLNKNQSILPPATAVSSAAVGSITPASGSGSGSGNTLTVVSSNNNTNTLTAATKTAPVMVPQLATPAAPTAVPAPAVPITLPTALPSGISISSNTPMSFGDAATLAAATPAAVPPAAPALSLIPTQPHHPPPLPSPALSVSSSVPPSPATSYAESSSSIADIARLEKMKVSDLKQQLKRRNLPVSGPKPQLIERLKPYLPLEPIELNTPAPAVAATEIITISDAMDTSNCAAPEQPVAMIVAESPAMLEHEQMDVVQQLDATHSMTLQTILPPQPQTATIILSNEELLREQQRKIDELQRQLQLSQLELQQIRQRHQQQQQQTVTAQVVNALPTQQITLITTTGNGPQQTLRVLPQLEKTTALIPAKVTVKAVPQSKLNGVQASAAAKKQNNHSISSNPPPINQKMVVKQQLEAKIQKQKAAAAAAQAQALAQQQQQQQQQQQVRLLTQKTQTVLIPTKNTSNNTNASKPNEKSTNAVRQSKNSNAHHQQQHQQQQQQQQQQQHAATVSATNSNTTMLVTQPKAHTTTTTTTTALHAQPHHNNVGLVWNEGNQTIFLLGLNDQHMTAHTLGNISLTTTTTTTMPNNNAVAATPAAKKLLNGHQRTNSLPSIVFPIEAKPLLTSQQLQQLQLQQQQQQQQQATRFPALQPGQQLIQLDIKPSTLATTATTPAPPPQYEEATKQLAATKAAAMCGMVPLLKIKEEPVTSPAAPVVAAVPPPPLTLQTAHNKRKSSSIKSEQVTDVLDILIKQGELPESALEPITPLTPLTPNGSNSLMTDLGGNLIFGGVMPPTTAAGGASIVPLVPKIEAPPTPQSVATLDMAMDTTPHSNESSLSYASNSTAANAALVAGHGHGYIENIDMASPLQPDAHIDAESVAKTLDIFLEQHHATPPPSTPPKSNSDKLGSDASPDAKLIHFDEYELLELMSQQLEMDIGDDSNTYCSAAVAGKGQNNNLCRDLNPSLQPCISELLDASSPDSVLLNNNHSADVEFDADSFVAQLSQHALGSAATSVNNNTSSGYHNNNSNVNSMVAANGLGDASSSSSSGGNVAINGGGHYNGTPMDVCDDFENTLNSFMQAVTQPQTGHCEYAAAVAPGMTNGMGVSMDSSSAGSGGSAVDAFNSSGDIFDLFNIDDYKMSWAAGDFTV